MNQDKVRIPNVNACTTQNLYIYNLLCFKVYLCFKNNYRGFQVKSKCTYAIY